ncbi:hypothetical protein K435DRAFT_859907 [Dendrothele bispora CBS 962.96]|uniref:Uncharacterized protein n=1 Tax=Dendrothele bispora (strain CBS 962.96) TaxID=1314807 RepID=A0A4S8M0G2_DENBC|nr:hypothetical protein K435DRAFT_859907 [Dendrothele bispora CBS 962.96]
MVVEQLWIIHKALAGTNFCCFNSAEEWQFRDGRPSVKEAADLRPAASLKLKEKKERGGRNIDKGDSCTGRQRRECIKILRSFHHASSLVNIDLTRLQEPLPTNPTPRPRTDIQESIEFCHYFALSNFRIRIRAHQIAGLNATECDFLPSFDNLAMAAFQQYNQAYSAASTTTPPSFDQLSDAQLLHGSRLTLRDPKAQTFEVICELHNQHAAEVYCDDELKQLFFSTEELMKRIATSFLCSELWQPIDPEFPAFEPSPMISFRHSLPKLTKPLIQDLAYPKPFDDPQNDDLRYPQPRSDAIHRRKVELEREIAKKMVEWLEIAEPANYYGRQMVKALKTDSRFVGDFLYGQTHPGKNKHTNDPFYQQLKSNFPVPSYRTPYIPDLNHDENTCPGCANYTIRHQNAISNSLLRDSDPTALVSNDEDVHMSSPPLRPVIQPLSPPDPEILSVPLESLPKIKNRAFVDVPSLKSQGKRHARDPTPSESGSDDEWQPDATSAKRKAPEEPVPVKSAKKPKPGAFKASSKAPQNPKSEPKIVDLAAIRDWVSKPLRNTPAIYFAYPSYTDSDLLPSIPWNNNDDQQIHPPSASERVNRISNYASPQMNIRPMEMWRSTTPPPVVSNRSFSRVQGNFSLSHTPGVIYLLPRDPCKLCVRQGFVCAYPKLACFSWDDPEPEKNRRCLGCRWRSQKCVLEEQDEPHLRPYQWDGYKFVPFHHRRPFVAPIDNNLTPTTERWRDIDTETDKGNAEAGPSGSS